MKEDRILRIYTDGGCAGNQSDKLYAKFVEWNGAQFSYEDFLYVTEKNNRADELANIGIDSIR